MNFNIYGFNLKKAFVYEKTSHVINWAQLFIKDLAYSVISLVVDIKRLAFTTVFKQSSDAMADGTPKKVGNLRFFDLYLKDKSTFRKN